MTIRRTMPAAWIILAVVFLAFMADAPGTAAEPEGGARSSLVGCTMPWTSRRPGVWT